MRVICNCSTYWRTATILIKSLISFFKQGYWSTLFLSFILQATNQLKLLFSCETVLDHCRFTERRQSLTISRCNLLTPRNLLPQKKKTETTSKKQKQKNKTHHIWSLALALVLSGQAVTPECLQNPPFIFTLCFIHLFFFLNIYFVPRQPQQSQ